VQAEAGPASPVAEPAGAPVEPEPEAAGEAHAEPAREDEPAER
jgi:hypothetical protein